MAEYASKQALIEQVEKAAALFIKEFEGTPETDRDQPMEGVDRTPAQMIAYQLAGFDHGLGQGRSRGEAGDHPLPRLQMEQLGRPLPELLREIFRILPDGTPGTVQRATQVIRGLACQLQRRRGVHTRQPQMGVLHALQLAGLAVGAHQHRQSLQILPQQDPDAIVNIKVIHWPSKTDPLALV